MKIQLMLFLAALLVLAGCRQRQDSYEAVLPSPDFNIHLYFNLFKGNPYYRVYYGKDKVLAWSVLGFRPKDGQDLTTGMVLREDSDGTDHGYDMLPPSFLSDVNYNSLSVPLRASGSGMAYAIDFMCFNAGVAFRYRLDKQDVMRNLAPVEVSEFLFDPSMGDYMISGAQDTLPRATGGELALPLHLEFAHGTTVRILSSNMEIPFTLRKFEEEDGHLFRVGIQDNDNLENSYTESLATPWRFLLINKTNPDE